MAIEVTGGVGTVYLEQLRNNHKSTNFEAIKTTGDSKSMMISKLLLNLECGNLTVLKDKFLIEELLSFQRTGKKLEAIQGKHDDLIMALAFAVQILPTKSNFLNLSPIGTYNC